MSDYSDPFEDFHACEGARNKPAENSKITREFLEKQYRGIIKMHTNDDGTVMVDDLVSALYWAFKLNSGILIRDATTPREAEQSI